jgi:hypothetical protein
MDDGQLGGMQAIREAFKQLQGSHPEVLSKLSAALSANRGQGFGAPKVEAALREAAVSLIPTDKDAAETLFALAELLAEVSRSNVNPRHEDK